MLEKTIKIPDTLYQQIKGVFGDDALDSFATTAMAELMSWLTAEERPMSISDLETNRIFMLYTHLYKKILPTAEDIGKLFNLPMGRSRYIVQNLNYRHPDFMKRRRIDSIIAALEKNEKSENGTPIVIIPKECEAYLIAISTELWLSNRAKYTVPSPTSRTKLTEGIRIELGINDKEPLLERLYSELEKLPKETKGE